MIAEIQHPTLGTVRGHLENGVAQFLGLKYASLNDRFAEAELILDYDSKPVNATAVGPQALSRPSACDDEFGLFQQSLPHDEFAISDQKCLHLNIATPHKMENLPVFVFIHGGAFKIGSAAWPQYNQSRLVALAVEIGFPFVGVTVNYRVGAPGFLTSAELVGAGYKPNNGLRDQRTALQWIQRFISGFGGDPNKVTLGGQSAGAAATMLQLHSSPNLFSQLLVMSGSSLLVQPLPRSLAEESYKALVHSMGLESLAVDARIRALVHGNGTDLYEKMAPDLPIFPVVDEDLGIGSFNYSALESGGGLNNIFPDVQTLPRLMIGDCQFDGHIFGLGLDRSPGIAKRFNKSLSNSLRSSPATVDLLVRTYGILEDVPEEVAFQNILKWFTDMGFLTPAVLLAKRWPGGDSFLYHFREPNPWSGPWQGETSHCLDVVFLFQNYKERIPVEQELRAKSWANAVIKFIAGLEPFPPCQSQSQQATVFGPSPNGSTLSQTDISEELRRETQIRQLTEQVSLDDLNRALHAFISGH